jgi:RNA polymerase sigma-70 factor (ECF subfamily)
MSAENTLIQKTIEGDQTAFRQLMNIYARRIYALAFDLAGDQYDAEDLTQEVFIKMYKNLDQFRGDSSLYTWLHRITLNTWLNMKNSKLYKKRKMELSIDEEDLYQEKKMQLVINQREITDFQKHIEFSLNKLSKKEKMAFVLKHYHDQSIKEIADTTGLTSGTVKSLLFRAVKKLRKNLSYYNQEVA